MTEYNALRNVLGLAMLATSLMACPLAANAADAQQEITTAATHAGLAAKSDTIQMVHTHMHHALNCLVGPGGNGFDTAALNPCKGQGNGAIPDETDASKKKSLEGVADTLRGGLKDDTLDTAQATAGDAAASLNDLK